MSSSLSLVPTFPARYEYLGKQFSGGQGLVYLCRDKNLERDVAIKFIQNVQNFGRLLDEITALQKVRSKNVIEIYDLLPYDGGKTVALVEEFVPGEDLAERIVNGSVPKDFDELLVQLFQVASGISDIHSQGVIHRDIKPNNAKIRPDGIVKLFDFGLAKLDGPAAATVGFKGTVGFAAPELYSVHVKIEKPIDVYSFGATAWWLSLAKLPTELQATPPGPYQSKIGQERKDLPSDVASLIDRALATLPQDRPTMKEICELIQKYMVRGKHHGLLVYQNSKWIVSKDSSAVSLKFGIAEAEIRYDGLEFSIKAVSGEVFVNNECVVGTRRLPGASVITFGGPELTFRRKFITFDISHPEVVL